MDHWKTSLIEWINSRRIQCRLGCVKAGCQFHVDIGIWSFGNCENYACFSNLETNLYLVHRIYFMLSHRTPPYIKANCFDHFLFSFYLLCADISRRGLVSMESTYIDFIIFIMLRATGANWSWYNWHYRGYCLPETVAIYALCPSLSSIHF